MYRRPSKGATQLPTHSPHYEMPNNVPALNVLPGVVTKAGTIGTGSRVKVKHDNGLESAHYHLRNIRVRVGQSLRMGEPVGLIYHNPSGYKLNHLHFEMWKNGVYIDPEPYLRNAQIVDMPGMPLWLKLGLIAGAGYWASRYIR